MNQEENKSQNEESPLKTSQEVLTKEEPFIDEKEAHPELSYLSLERRKRPHRHRPIFGPRVINALNEKNVTTIIMGYSFVLGFLFIAFGILEILTLFGIREERTWRVYSATAFFGWSGQFMTAIVEIIIGIVIFWSLALYFQREVQKGDSYLIIGTGIGVFFGMIYVLIIVADILNALIDAVSESASIAISTAFYTPVLLAIITFPVFLMIRLRHKMIILEIPSIKEEGAESQAIEEKEVQPMVRTSDSQQVERGRRGRGRGKISRRHKQKYFRKGDSPWGSWRRWGKTSRRYKRGKKKE